MVLGDPAFRVYLYDDDDLSSSFVRFSLEFSSFSLSEVICISDSLFLSFKFLLCLCLMPVSPLRVSHVLYLCPLSSVYSLYVSCWFFLLFMPRSLHLSLPCQSFMCPIVFPRQVVSLSLRLSGFSLLF